MSARIPTSVTTDELVAATKPLFDLLGVSAGEVVGDLHFVHAPDSENFYAIRFDVVASPDSTQEIPEAVFTEGHPQGDEFAPWTHRINVAVTE